jgi:hypothetical protein
MRREVIPGDPASCSALGGALRRRAEVLRERRTALRHSTSALLSWGGPAAEDLADRLRALLSEVDQMAGRLDEVGAALQAYATDLAHARDNGARAADAAAGQGLVVDDFGTVHPQPGPARMDIAARRDAAVPLVQHQVDGAIGEARAAAHRLRRRTTSALHALRPDAGRLAALDAELSRAARSAHTMLDGPGR